MIASFIIVCVGFVVACFFLYSYVQIAKEQNNIIERQQKLIKRYAKAVEELDC